LGHRGFLFAPFAWARSLPYRSQTPASKGYWLSSMRKLQLSIKPTATAWQRFLCVCHMTEQRVAAIAADNIVEAALPGDYPTVVKGEIVF